MVGFATGLAGGLGTALCIAGLIGVRRSLKSALNTKGTYTLDALLVSPARLWQVVAGKALAGLFYCLAAAVVVFAFNTRIVVHWEIAALAAVLGAAFAVAVGLLNVAALGVAAFVCYALLVWRVQRMDR